MTALTTAQRARLVMVISVAVTAVLYVVPYGRMLAYPLMLLSTLAHELGHGVAAVLIGGDFERFQMWPDGSGVAFMSIADHRLAQAFVAAGGLLGPAAVAAVVFAVGRRARGARRCLLGMAVLLTLTVLLVVRGTFGIFFVVMLIVTCWLVARRASGDIAQLVLIFFAVQLALSVFSRGDYLFTPVARTAGGTMPSDVGQIAQALWLPYWFWGGVCGLASVLVLAFGVRRYWR